MFGAEYGEGGEDAVITLMEGDWAGYDESVDESVGIYEFKSQFVRAGK